MIKLLIYFLAPGSVWLGACGMAWAGAANYLPLVVLGVLLVGFLFNFWRHEQLTSLVSELRRESDDRYPPQL